MHIQGIETFRVCESGRVITLDSMNGTTADTTTRGVLTPKGKVLMKSYNRYWNSGTEPLAETIDRAPRNLTRFEQAGNNIMITIKTTKSYHRKRIQVLMDTWISAINASNVFLVTDDFDIEYEKKVKSMGKLTGNHLCSNNFGSNHKICNV